MLHVGVDCHETKRFRRKPYHKNKRLYEKIFTRQEIEYCLRYKYPHERFAARFAAKEAVIKALNSIAPPRYVDIEIKKDNTNKPKVYIDKKRFKKTSGISMALSLTHSNSYAVAFVVATDNRRSMKKRAEEIVKRSASYAKNAMDEYAKNKKLEDLHSEIKD